MESCCQIPTIVHLHIRFLIYISLIYILPLAGVIFSLCNEHFPTFVGFGCKKNKKKISLFSFRFFAEINPCGEIHCKAKKNNPERNRCHKGQPELRGKTTPQAGFLSFELSPLIVLPTCGVPCLLV